MDDIAPRLIESVMAQFRNAYNSSHKVRTLQAKVEAGTATYAEAQQYALEVYKLIGNAYKKLVSSDTLPDGRMYYNIAERLIPATLNENYKLVSDYAKQVQDALNKKAGIGLKAKTAELNQDRVNGLVSLASSTERYDEIARQLLSAFENFSQNVVDETIKVNADFHASVGLSPKLIRKAESKCCKWCRGLAGTYDYPVSREFYRRHENCRCTVLYDPADGSKKYQNVHTKQWQTAEERAKLESRKQLGLKSVAQQLSEHPKRLASYSPSSLKVALEQDGFEVKPLKQGSLKNITFEEGGGFKVNFEDGGLLQYHPAKNSHHGGAYYKISTGKGGTHWYELDGTEKKEKK